MSDFAERRIGDVIVRVDRRTCIGSANCVKVEPALFRLDDEGIASFAAGADRVSREAILEACSVCPVEALHVTTVGGEPLVP